MKNTRKLGKQKQEKNIHRLPGEILQIETVDTPQGNVEVLVPIPKSNISARRTADKIKKKYKNIRQKKALKLATLRGNEQIVNKTENKPKSTKSAQIAAKKTEKYKKMRKENNISVGEEIRQAASTKSAQITAKKLSDKYKKVQYKKPPPPFNFRELADAESEEPQIRDVLSKKSTQIAANKISDKYKKIRVKIGQSWQKQTQ